MADVNVCLGDRSYTVYIENILTSQLETCLKKAHLSSKVLVISDKNVGTLYGPQLLDDLHKCGFSPEIYCVEPGEGSKSLETAMDLYTKAIQMGLERKSAIIALGGGVVGDLSGFIAATYLRGIPFFQIPTSLLAQIDSSVGGKVAVNHPLGKNLIGAFYQPKGVFIQPSMLHTLPKRELLSGLAEVIKYGMIADEELLSFMEIHCEKILAKDMDCLELLIKRSCEIKAEVVQKDEKESSLRMILNFGHTIGHAIEGVTGFKKYTHGEAVAMGMLGAAKISYYLEKCSLECVSRLKNLLIQYQLPVTPLDCAVNELLAYISRDKKAVSSQINWILLNHTGNVYIDNQVPVETIRLVLNELISNNV